jgi:sec-independent protein translocase protein TatA
MPTLGPTELIIILLVVLLLFGGRKLPELARSIGGSMKELRKGMSDGVEEDKKDTAKNTKATDEKA